MSSIKKEAERCLKCKKAQGNYLYQLSAKMLYLILNNLCYKVCILPMLRLEFWSR